MLRAMPELDFAIVDPHIHQWDPQTTPRPTSFLARALKRFPDLYLKIGRKLVAGPILGFVGKPDGVLLPYMPQNHAADCAAFPVDTVVHVEAGWLGFKKLAAADETRWIDGLDFPAYGKRVGAIVGHADFHKPHAGEQLAAHERASTKFRGIRQMAAAHPDRSIFAWSRVPNLYANAEFLRGFELLEQKKLRFDAFVYSNQLGDVAALAQRFPNVPIVLDHVGTPVAAAGQVGNVGKTEDERMRIVGEWRDALARVAEHKNVHVKLSGLAMPILGFGFHRRPSPPSVEELTEALGPFLRHAIDVFGVERGFFASNFPMDRVSAPWDRLFSAYLAIAKERGPAAPRALLRDNALRFYGI